MKTRLFIGGCLVGAAAALLGTQAISQQAGQEPSPEQMQQMMADYLDLMKPGPDHRKLDQSIGTFDTTIKMWWGGPGSPPVETTGTATRKWILDGRYVMEEMQADMMMPDLQTGGMKKMPWSGMGMTGFDSYRKMYVSTWADSMSTALSVAKGTADPSGDGFTYYAEMDEPMLGVIGRMIKYTITHVSKDRTIFEMYDLHAGDDFKVMEIVYTRRG